MSLTSLLLITAAFYGGRHIGRHPETLKHLQTEAIALAGDLQRLGQLLLQLAAALYAAFCVSRSFLQRLIDRVQHPQADPQPQPANAPAVVALAVEPEAPAPAKPARRSPARKRSGFSTASNAQLA